MAELPDEIWALIADCIETPRDWFSLSLICRQTSLILTDFLIVKRSLMYRLLCEPYHVYNYPEGAQYCRNGFYITEKGTICNVDLAAEYGDLEDLDRIYQEFGLRICANEVRLIDYGSYYYGMMDTALIWFNDWLTLTTCKGLIPVPSDTLLIKHTATKTEPILIFMRECGLEVIVYDDNPQELLNSSLLHREMLNLDGNRYIGFDCEDNVITVLTENFDLIKFEVDYQEKYIQRSLLGKSKALLTGKNRDLYQPIIKSAIINR